MTETEHIKETLLEYGYEFKKTIGGGGFSNVYLCQSIKYNQDFAIKRSNKDNLKKEEFDILITLNHPNIIKIYDAFEDETSQYLVMEYCSNGTILQKGKLSYEQFIYYSKQILNALDYCHSKKIAHRDIKPENILIDSYDNVKLADFGMAKIFEDFEKSREKCGSIKFFAPEMFLYKEICPFKADIWATGITFYCMAVGEYPFASYSREKLKQSILLGDMDFVKNKIDPRIQYIINAMTQYQTDLRPSTTKLLTLPMYQISSKSYLLGKSSRQFTSHKFIQKSFISSSNSTTTFNANKTGSLDYVRQAAPLTKLHSYKSINHSPSVHQINRRFIFPKV